MVNKMNYYDYIYLIVGWQVFATVIELAISMDEIDCPHLMTPSFFYDMGMNWFGAYVCVVLIGIISPTMFIFKTLKWLFTVGR